MSVSKDFEELFTCLNAHGVRALRNKLASGRPQDQLDLAALREERS